MACGKRDSAIIYSQRIIDNGKDQNNMYDAAKQLFRLYEEQGDVVNAHRYAVLYMQLSDTLDFGRRQEQAATLTNAYKYHMDQKKEMELRDEKEMYARTLFVSIFVFTLLGAGGAIVFIHRRNVHLRKMLELSERIEQMAHNEQELRKEMERKEVELRESKEDLGSPDKSGGEFFNSIENLYLCTMNNQGLLALAQLILPSEILSNFEVVRVEEEASLIRIYLDESVKAEYKENPEIESKGFCEAVTIRDFPIRDKGVDLIVRRRKWYDKQNNRYFSDFYDLKAEETRYSKEFAAFLKGVYGDDSYDLPFA